MSNGLEHIFDGQSSIRAAREGEVHHGMRKWIVVIISGLLVGLITSIVILVSAPILREWFSPFAPSGVDRATVTQTDPQGLSQEIQKEGKQIAVLQKKFDGLTPQHPYVIISTSENHIDLMSKGKLMRRGVCSTGSYVLLKASGNREWIFKTPRGMFRVDNKLTSPIWRKPDWAFVEEGLPIPPKDSPDRFEAGVLGDYALSFGNGYLIHGTLYKRMLGMPVTHGCVRVGDEDLEVVFENMQGGSKVFIY